jgi:hypothetical protein
MSTIETRAIEVDHIARKEANETARSYYCTSHGPLYRAPGTITLCGLKLAVPTLLFTKVHQVVHGGRRGVRTR